MDPMILNRQWSERPDDQRFVSLADLHNYNEDKRLRSVEAGVALDLLRVRATDQGGMALVDPKTDQSALFSNWAFGQLCQRVGAPAGYLRTLPATLAQAPLQWTLEQNEEEAKLLQRNNGAWTVDAVTSDSYGRIYDAAMTGALIKFVDTERWKVPAASYATRDPKRATTLYASDRDCFVALVDDKTPVEIPGAPDERLFRGFIVRNSEVGAAAYDLYLFLYRYICDNRIIWGLGENKQFKIRHTSGGPMRFMREASPALQQYLTQGTAETVALIQQARDKPVGKTEKDVSEWLRARGFTQTESKRAAELAATDEGGADPRSLWGVVQGATALAKAAPFGDMRLDLERRASRLLDVLK